MRVRDCQIVCKLLADFANVIYIIVPLGTRVLTKSSYEVSSSPLLDALGCEKLISNRRKHKVIVAFKSLHNLTPMYFHNMFCKYKTNYDLRNSVNKLILLILLWNEQTR